MNKKYILTIAALSGIIAAPLAQGAIAWTAGAPGGTSGGALEFGGNAATDFLATGIAADDIGGNRGGGTPTDYTIGLWINADTNNDNQWFLGTGNRGLHLGIQNGNSLEVGHWSADSSGTTTVPAGTWVHATFTYDADGGTGGTTGLQTIYFNGAFDGSADNAAPDQSGTDLQIGSRNGTSGPAFTGSLDDVAIWNTVLSATDIADLASGAQSATDLGALAYYDFEDDQTGTTAAVQGTGLGATTLTGIEAIPEPSSMALIILGAAGFLRRCLLYTSPSPRD